MENLPYVYRMEELEALIAEWGFLPFFPNRVQGFSIFDVMDEERIFNATRDCAWNWKGPIISHWEAAYGKFFGGKAGYIHLSWLPDFMNWRRSVYPLEGYSAEARHILDVLRENESMLSRPLKRASGFTLGRKKRLFADPDDPTKIIREKHTGSDFDALIVKLQIGTYVCIADFEPAPGRSGEYGWALSVYSTPEAMYDFSGRLDPGFTFADSPISDVPTGVGLNGSVSQGEDLHNSSAPGDPGSHGPVIPAEPDFNPQDFLAGIAEPSPRSDWRSAVDGRTPEQSRDRILTHLRSLFPEAPDKAWNSLI